MLNNDELFNICIKKYYISESNIEAALHVQNFKLFKMLMDKKFN